MQIGKSESVIHWDESNFSRAQRWAQYAEQVYRKLKNKPSLVQVLSNFMKETNTGGVQFTFNDLQVATEKLRQVLLNNPHLSSTQFSQVLDMYQVDFHAESNKNLEKVVTDAYSISCSKGTFLMLSSIKDKLEGDKSTGRAEGTYLDICAKLVWAEIGKLMAKQKEGCGLIKKIESLALCNDKGVEIVLRMLVLFIKGKIPVNNTPSSSRTVLDQVKDHIHRWIVECSKHDKIDNYKKIWACPPSLLCEMSAFDMLFCESYLSFLYSCGDGLLGIKSDTVDCGDQKTEISYDSRYRHILEQVQLLLQGPEYVSELCKQKFMLWSVHDSEGETLNRSCDVPSRDQKLRANLWKKIYYETCK